MATQRWNERAIESIRGSTAKAWTALGGNLYLRVHVGKDGRVHKSFYWRGGAGSKFRSLGGWPDMKLSAARDAVAQIRTGARQVASVVTFASAAEDFFANLPPSLRQTTRDDLASLYRVHLQASLGPKKLRDLKPADVSAVLSKITRQGIRETAIKAASLTRRILDRAVVQGHASQNIAAAFKSGYLGGRSPARTRVLVDAEIDGFLKASHAHPRGNVVRFLLATGCRVNETVNAQRAWLQGRVLTLPPTITKQQREHRVSLSTYALQQLQHPAGAYLFPSPFHKGRDAQSREAAWLTASTIFKAAGIAGATTHDLRRTARTKWAELKVDPLVAEHMMGHSLPGMLGIYDQSRRDADAALAWEMWGNWLQQRDVVGA